MAYVPQSDACDLPNSETPMSAARINAQNVRVARVGNHFSFGNAVMSGIVNKLTPPPPTGACDDFTHAPLLMYPWPAPMPRWAAKPQTKTATVPPAPSAGIVPTAAGLGAYLRTRGLSGLSGLGDAGTGSSETYTWPQSGVRENTLQLKNKILSVQSVTVNGVPQTVATSSNPANKPPLPPDYIWYWNAGTTQIAPQQMPPVGAVVVVNYVGTPAAPAAPAAALNPVTSVAPPPAPANAGTGLYPYGWISSALASGYIPSYNCPSSALPPGAGGPAGSGPPTKPAGNLFLWGVLIALGAFFVVTGDE